MLPKTYFTVTVQVEDDLPSWVFTVITVVPVLIPFITPLDTVTIAVLLDNHVTGCQAGGLVTPGYMIFAPREVAEPLAKVKEDLFIVSVIPFAELKAQIFNESVPPTPQMDDI